MNAMVAFVPCHQRRCCCSKDAEMEVFGAYARYYDLLYRAKDYVGEAQFVHQLLQTYAPNAKSILDLGCGTGGHAILLANYGYSIHGVDFSLDMLQRAHQNLEQAPENLAAQLKFSQGDIRKLQLNRQFDAIISLFHVVIKGRQRVRMASCTVFQSSCTAGCQDGPNGGSAIVAADSIMVLTPCPFRRPPESTGNSTDAKPIAHGCDTKRLDRPYPHHQKAPLVRLPSALPYHLALDRRPKH